jgi:hypothetical protein
MFKFIHKLAIKGYKNDIETFINQISSLENEQLADYFICSVWTRAGLQNEGWFVFPDGSLNLSPRLSAYPLMIEQFNRPIKLMRKRGQKIEPAFLSIWVYTLKGLIDPELDDVLSKMWSHLMATKDFWDFYLTKFYNDDLKSGTDPKLLDKTLALSKEILNQLPPQHL